MGTALRLLTILAATSIGLVTASIHGSDATPRVVRVRFDGDRVVLEERGRNGLDEVIFDQAINPEDPGDALLELRVAMGRTSVVTDMLEIHADRDTPWGFVSWVINMGYESRNWQDSVARLELPDGRTATTRLDIPGFEWRLQYAYPTLAVGIRANGPPGVVVLRRDPLANAPASLDEALRMVSGDAPPIGLLIRANSVDLPTGEPTCAQALPVVARCTATDIPFMILRSPLPVTPAPGR